MREYLEIAALHVTLREQAKEVRLIELLHRAVPYPVLLLVESKHTVSVSLGHKRQAFKEAGKVALDGEPATVVLPSADSAIYAAFLQGIGSEPPAADLVVRALPRLARYGSRAAG